MPRSSSPVPPEADAPTVTAKPEAEAVPQARYRSGAVARMLRMPVATLRVWERRYGVTQPSLSPSGQRLYAAADVRRLALLKQLVDLGHAIGRLAALDMAQLQAVASTHAGALASRRSVEPPAVAAPNEGPRRLAVIGAALPAALVIDPDWHCLGPFPDMTSAAHALSGQRVDALLLREAHLHEADEGQPLRQRLAAVPGWSALPVALIYRFGTERACQRLVAEGVHLLREPQPAAALAPWLRLCLGAPAPAGPAATQAAPFPGEPASDPPPARRWDDAALADFAALSTTVACECPRHLAELLLQLTHFEAYSAECAHRSPADAALHGYLRRVTAGARAQFETALEQVARHEGLLPLP